MSMPQFEPDSVDPLAPVESGATLETDQPAVDPSLQVRFLQILASQVVEALRESPHAEPLPSNRPPR